MNTNKPAQLLPNSSTTLERDLADTLLNELGDFDFTDIHSPDRCPKLLLGWLAWERHVEGYDESWPEDRKRDAIRNAPNVSMRKGSIASMRNAIRAAGLGEIEFITRGKRYKHNAKIKHNGKQRYGNITDMKWAEYSVAFKTLLTSTQLNLARKILEATTSARNQLISVQYDAPAKHNRTIKHNGRYRYGVR